MSKTKWYSKPIYVVVALVLVLSLGIVALPMAGTVEASPGEWYVDDDSATGGDGTTPAITGDHRAFHTIGDAITAALPGDTINVAAGTYEENVNVTKSVTIDGQGVATLIAGIEYWTGKRGDGFRVIASDVTITGFTIIGHYDGIQQDFNNPGIIIGGTFPGDYGNLGVERVTVSSNVFRDSWSAIYVWKSSNNLIEGNEIYNMDWRAIQVYDGSSDAQLAYDPVYNDGNSANGEYSNSPVRDWQGNVLTLTEGELIYPSQNNSIIGNEIHNAWGGIFVGAWGPATQITNNSGTIIEGNSFYDLTDTAVMTGYTSGLININQPGATRWSYEVYDAFDVVNVPDDNVFDSAWTCTIQAAINAVREGGTINVAAGTYTEQVTISKSLMLSGAAASSTIIQPIPGTLTGDADGYKNIVTISGAGVNVEFTGFTVSGPGTATGGSINAGIRVLGSAHANIHHNNIVDIRNEPFSGYQTVWGILVGCCYWGGPDRTGTATIANNTITSYQKGGIEVGGTGSSATIENNTITGVGTTPLIAAYSICLGRSATATIKGNVIEDNDYADAYYAGQGILTWFPGSGPQIIKENEIRNNCQGISIFGPGQNALIEANNIHDNVQYGVFLASNASGTRIIGNDILNNGTNRNPPYDAGILVLDVPAWKPFPTLGNEAHFNNIVGNFRGVNVLQSPGNPYSADTFDATCNWWGSADGPFGIGPGSGDAVSANVDYDPWLKTPSPYPLFAMASFVIDHAKIDLKKKPDDDKVRVSGKLELDLDCGDDVDVSEPVTVTVGPLTEIIPGGTMVAKGKKGEAWEYKRPKRGEGNIKHMTIDWKNGKFDIRMDKADLTGMPNPVTISIQIGDDLGEETIKMREKKHHWDYKAHGH